MAVARMSAEAATRAATGIEGYRKLLKMRDFRAEAGFPLSLKRATMPAPIRAIGRA
jgi:hypothetical protein